MTQTFPQISPLQASAQRGRRRGKRRLLQAPRQEKHQVRNLSQEKVTLRRLGFSSFYPSGYLIFIFQRDGPMFWPLGVRPGVTVCEHLVWGPRLPRPLQHAALPRGRGLWGPEDGRDVLPGPREAARVEVGQEQPRQEVLQQSQQRPGVGAPAQPLQPGAPGARQGWVVQCTTKIWATFMSTQSLAKYVVWEKRERNQSKR